MIEMIVAALLCLLVAILFYKLDKQNSGNSIQQTENYPTLPIVSRARASMEKVRKVFDFSYTPVEVLIGKLHYVHRGHRHAHYRRSRRAA